MLISFKNYPNQPKALAVRQVIDSWGRGTEDKSGHRGLIEYSIYCISHHERQLQRYIYFAIIH
jgi:hypothetical protein